MSDLDDWLASRPDCVRQLAAEFPIGTEVHVGDVVLHVIGYTEADQVIVSPVWAADDYEESLAQKQVLCASHLRTVN